MKKGFLLLSICFLFIKVQSQSKEDSLNAFEIKASKYLLQTYANKDFDSSIKSWHSFVVQDVEHLYKEKGSVFSHQSDLLERIKKDYQLFYATHKSFSIISFVSSDISDEGKGPIFYFQYKYQEKVNEKICERLSCLYFIYDKALSDWKIWDFRVSEVLGDPKRWLK